MMFIKLTICLAIITLSLISGNIAGRKFTNRVESINDMMMALKLLEGNIMYTYDPIPKALLNVSKKARGSAKVFFREMGEGIAGGYVADFHALWDETANQVLGNSALQEKEIRIIKDFGAGFGTTDAENQHMLFLHTNQMLEMQLEEAMSDQSQKPRIYQSIGTAMGILIVILLI